MTDFRHFYDDILKSFGRYPMIIHGDQTITYQEFDERTNRLAHALMEIGVRRGLEDHRAVPSP